MMGVADFIKVFLPLLTTVEKLTLQSEPPEPEMTYPLSPVAPVLYFAPDEMPSGSKSHDSDPENEPGLSGLVHDLQYIEDDIGVRRRSSAVRMDQVRGTSFVSRRRSSIPL